MSRKLSTDFYEHEVTASEDHPDLALAYHELTPEQAANAQRCIDRGLQPIRDYTKHPIEVLSFVRSQELNDQLPRSSPTSDHLDGHAADWKPTGPGPSPEELLEDLKAGRVPGATWDKLNFYSDTRTFHIAQRDPAEGPNRKRTYVDWQRIA